MASRTRPTSPTRHLSALATAALAATAAAGSTHAAAQGEPPVVQTVTISGRGSAPASIAGFGDVPLVRAPFSATVIHTDRLRDAGITGIADLTRLDAGVTDAYNAPGYWGELSVRGFTLDNRFNYRRDGLPINAETVIAQGNKQAIEILKGTSGLQAGTSAPGGLVNLVVKRPLNRVAQASLGWTERGSLGAAADLGHRHGGQGWRLNAEAEHLRPQTRDSQGQRRLVALAFEQQLAAGLLEAELEWSRQSQPSTPGFSLLGDRVPDARDTDPRTNLNNQAWSLPVVMDGTTGSLRYSHHLTPDLTVVAHAMRQRLDSDDRVAFPFGCSAAGQYDRYCADGSFDLYDYRSEGERRTTDAADLRLEGRARLAGLAHRFNLGLLGTRHEAQFQPQAYNGVGTGHIDASVQRAPDARALDPNTQRQERSTELHLQDTVALDPDWHLWLGLRHSRLQRESVRTDGSRGTRYRQAFTTPWLALSHHLDAQRTVYASWGEGVESEVAPNRSRYTNAGQALPALKSRQAEIGFKHGSATLDWRVAAFSIQRPAWRDIGACDDPDTCTRRVDGRVRHRGAEAEVDWRTGPWNLRASAMALQARRSGSSEPGLNGLKPTNVPERSLKLQAAYNVQALPGLALLGFVTHEGARQALPDNSAGIPGWTRIDLALRHSQRLAGHTVVWRAGVDNLANRRAWQMSPYKFDHAYLYPLAPRSLHASAQVAF